MIAVKFVAALEGNEKRAYVPKAGNSGVTVGLGLDIAAFGDLTVLGLSEDLYNKLIPYRGFRREVAEVYLEDNPLELTEEELLELNTAVVQYKTTMIRSWWRKDSALDWYNDLNMAQRTVVYSVLHQYGSPRRVPKFWGLVTRGMWRDVVIELRDFKDSYRTRRNREADYLEESLHV